MSETVNREGDSGFLNVAKQNATIRRETKARYFLSLFGVSGDGGYYPFFRDVLNQTFAKGVFGKKDIAGRGNGDVIRVTDVGFGVGLCKQGKSGTIVTVY